MDKICRGSRVGDAHVVGSLDRAANLQQGNNVTRSQSTGTMRFTNTLHCQQANDVSPRFARPCTDLSPGPSPRTARGGANDFSPRSSAWSTQQRSKSRSDMLRSPRQESVPDLFGRSSCASERSPRSARRLKENMTEASLLNGVAGLTRGRSETALGHGSGTGYLSPRDTLYDNRVGVADMHRGTNLEGRARSPTFTMSEQWMETTTESLSSTKQQCDNAMPSSNFGSTIRRMHSGKITRNSENWLRMDGQDATPAASVISNSCDHSISRGKKTGLEKDPQAAKQLMRQDINKVPENVKGQQRHQFQNLPQAQYHIDELRALSPRHLAQAATADAMSTRGNQESAGVAVLHRTSGEMAASIGPDQAAPWSRPAEKYVLGCEIVDMRHTGVRAAKDCVKHACLSGGYPTRSSSLGSMVNFRHHLNSDIVREHMTPQYMHSNTMALPSSRQEASRRIHVYGEYSTPPATMSKDTAYIQSGLRLVKYQTRAPGKFSPNAVRVPASIIYTAQ
eukprot:TRINITY_DN15357_c0_g1_i1.p1 TRINITY_DN15357_c0_g1~~TRINITY_DN15357_c0_g1_i1.p1  ORF type:complete len:508 (+),score=50.98 TRINITY_DN15357_c0_g1_i1:110-1633(+)